MSKSKRTRNDKAMEERIAQFHELRRKLPFTSTDLAYGQRGWWTIPAKGGYTGGCQSGQAAAHAFLKYLRERARPFGGGTLQHIVLDMLGSEKMSVSLRGQVVGFFSTLDYYLGQLAAIDSGFDYVPFEALRERVEKGVARTRADELAEAKKFRSDVAKRAWERRRQKAA